MFKIIKIIAKMFKSKVKSQILAFILSISLIMPHYTFATMVTHDPTSFAQVAANFAETIEKYNNMIKTATDTLDTMNRINDVVNTATNMLDNLQTGIANPKQIADRFQQNLEGIKRNFERTAKSLEERDWLNTFVKEEYASCKKKWQNLLAKYEEKQQRKEMSEIESTQEQCMKNGGSEEDCKAATDLTKATYNENMKEIETGMNILEQGYNSGFTDMNNVIHGAFDKAKNTMNYANVENQLQGIQNPYNYQVNICNKVEEEILKSELEESKNCYIQYTKAGNKKEANKCWEKAKKTIQQTQQQKRDRTKLVWDKANIQFNKGNTGDNKATVLDINDKSGELMPNLQEWRTQLKKPYTEGDIKQTIPVTVTTVDSEGKSKQEQKDVWVVRQDIIIEMMKNGRYNEALSLQNRRNMAIAMQGDNQALAKAQLETFAMLGQQLNILNETVAELGNVNNRMLELFENTKTEEEFQKVDADMKTFKSPIAKNDNERSWEYDEYGLVKIKPKKEKVIK